MRNVRFHRATMEPGRSGARPAPAECNEFMVEIRLCHANDARAVNGYVSNKSLKLLSSNKKSRSRSSNHETTMSGTTMTDDADRASIATNDVPLGVPDIVIEPALPNRPESRAGIPAQEHIELGLRSRMVRDVSSSTLPPPYELLPSVLGTIPGTAATSGQRRRAPRSCGGSCPAISAQATDSLYLLSQFLIVLLSAAVVVLFAIGTPTTPIVSPEANSADLVAFSIYGSPSRGPTPLAPNNNTPSEDELKAAFGDSLYLFRPWYGKVANQSRIGLDLGLRLNLTLRSLSSVPWTVESVAVTARFPDSRTTTAHAVNPGFRINGTGLFTIPIYLNFSRTFDRFTAITNDTGGSIRALSDKPCRLTFCRQC